MSSDFRNDDELYEHSKTGKVGKTGKIKKPILSLRLHESDPEYFYAAILHAIKHDEIIRLLVNGSMRELFDVTLSATKDAYILQAYYNDMQKGKQSIAFNLTELIPPERDPEEDD